LGRNRYGKADCLYDSVKQKGKTEGLCHDLQVVDRKGKILGGWPTALLWDTCPDYSGFATILAVRAGVALLPVKKG
jgi:hypothetical protein